MRSRCTHQRHFPRTLRSDTVDTHERSDCKAIPFLTSHVHGHVLHSNGWLVVSPRPPPYAASACPPARSQSHVMFHHSARVDEATISKSPRPSGSAQTHPLTRPFRAPHPCTSRPYNGPLSSPAIPISREPVTLGAHARHTTLRPGSHLVLPERSQLVKPRTSEGILPLPQSMHASF